MHPSSKRTKTSPRTENLSTKNTNKNSYFSVDFTQNDINKFSSIRHNLNFFKVVIRGHSLRSFFFFTNLQTKQISKTSYSSSLLKSLMQSRTFNPIATSAADHDSSASNSAQSALLLPRSVPPVVRRLSRSLSLVFIYSILTSY